MSAKQSNDMNRRSFRNVLISPRQQLRYSFLLVIGSCLTLGIFVGVLIWQFNQTIFALSQAYTIDAEILEAIQKSLSSALKMGVVLSAIGIGSGVFLSIRLTHKLYGPMVAIRRFLTELGNGNYKARLTLRQGDDLLDLRDALNQLAESLEKKHGK